MARARAAALAGGTLTSKHTGFSRPSAQRAYAWLVGWPAREAHESKSADRRRFVEALCRIEPSIQVAASLARASWA